MPDILSPIEIGGRDRKYTKACWRPTLQCASAIPGCDMPQINENRLFTSYEQGVCAADKEPGYQE
jgi:hypothetical protein